MIYACGCSFTYGDELQQPQESAWPVLLGNKLNQTVVNSAISGGTNQRTVYQTIKNLKDDYDLYLIAWTTYARFTFYKSDNNFEINFGANMINTLYGKEKFYYEWSHTLYKVWYNELYAFKLWLQQIIQLQKLLESKNYLMINTMDNNLNLWLAPKDKFSKVVKDLINSEVMTDSQIIAEYEEIQYYISLIDTAAFYKWNDFHIMQLCDSFECGPGKHFLEEGHNHLADLIYQHVQNDSKLLLDI